MEIRRAASSSVLSDQGVGDELRGIVRALASPVYSIANLDASLFRAAEIDYAVDHAGTICAFAMYEAIPAGGELTGAAVYRSGLFVAPYMRRSGLGTALTRAQIVDRRPAIFSFSTRLDYWFVSMREFLTLSGYRCFPEIGRSPPTAVYNVAKEILHKTGRADTALDERLVRRGVYSEASWELKHPMPVIEGLAPEDAVMLVSFDSSK